MLNYEKKVSKNFNFILKRKRVFRNPTILSNNYIIIIIKKKKKKKKGKSTYR